MGKNRFDHMVNIFFVALAALTFFNLYKNIIWLSGVLAVLFLAYLILHIRLYRAEKLKSKKIFVLTLIIMLNFLLANAVIVIADFVYPY